MIPGRREPIHRHLNQMLGTDGRAEFASFAELLIDDDPPFGHAHLRAPASNDTPVQFPTPVQTVTGILVKLPISENSTPDQLDFAHTIIDL